MKCDGDNHPVNFTSHEGMGEMRFLCDCMPPIVRKLLGIAKEAFARPLDEMKDGAPNKQKFFKRVGEIAGDYEPNFVEENGHLSIFFDRPVDLVCLYASLSAAVGILTEQHGKQIAPHEFDMKDCPEWAMRLIVTGKRLIDASTRILNDIT